MAVRYVLMPGGDYVKLEHPDPPSDESIFVTHARKQGAADGFQQGWHAALLRIAEGDTIETLRELVPRAAALDAAPSPKNEWDEWFCEAHQPPHESCPCCEAIYAVRQRREAEETLATQTKAIADLQQQLKEWQRRYWREKDRHATK